MENLHIIEWICSFFKNIKFPIFVKKCFAKREYKNIFYDERGVYWGVEKESGNKVALCPFCYDKEGVLVHMTKHDGTYGNIYYCHPCGYKTPYINEQQKSPES